MYDRNGNPALSVQAGNGEILPVSAENPLHIRLVNEGGSPVFGGGSGASLTPEQTSALEKLPEISKKIQKLEENPANPTMQKIRVKYFAGKGEKKPTAIPNMANFVGTFTNSTNYQYAGKKVTAVGFITGTPGQIELRLCEQVQPLTFEVATRIELKEGSEMQWYPVDINVPEGKWLAVKCNVGTFKYASATTNDIGGSGFLTITAGIPNPVTAGGSSSYLGFGIEVEETIDASKPYAGKKFAVIGDSISTFQDYITPGNAVYYNAEKQAQFGLTNVDDTWWKKAIDGLGGLLNTNDAWSGSRVSGDGGGFAFLRTNRIDANTDVCMIMLGINDLSGAVPLGEIGEIGASHDRTTICGAFQQGLEKMQGFYPNMEIVLITNTNRWMSGVLNANTNGLTTTQLQDKISEIAKLYGLKCVHLGEIGHNKFTHSSLLPDNTHPNKLGMERIANKVIAELS